MLASAAATLLVIQLTVGNFRVDSAESDEAPEVDAAPPAEQVRVMPVGDSLTQGSIGDHTWRYWLWQHMDDEAELAAEFVGPYDGLANLDPDVFPDTPEDEGAASHYADPDFDQAHASLWGATAEELATDIGTFVTDHEPDYLLVLAGINDLRGGASSEEALEHVHDLVDAARVARGDVQIVLGELPPVWGSNQDQELNADIDAFNRTLGQLATELTGEDSPVTVAATAADYAPDRDNWDAVHPNAQGEQKIAAAFADILADDLNLGSAYPRPLADVPVGPRTAPEVTAEADQGAAVLSWDPVPGSTGYQVWQRREAPDRDELVPIPEEVLNRDGAEPSATVTELLAGATYTFYVAGVKGDDVGERSQEVEVTIDDAEAEAPDSVELVDDVLSWSTVPEATHYEVLYRALDCDGTGCTPRDDDHPNPDADWEMSAIVEEGTEWETDTATSGYEFAVRSHRDYLPGEVSAAVTAAD